MIYMFLEVTQLKGLIIDLDSFPDSWWSVWDDVNERVQCLFLSLNTKKLDAISGRYRDCLVYKGVLPSSAPAFSLIVKAIGLHSYEIAFVSGDLDRIKDAMSCSMGTILIRNQGIVEHESNWLPDFIFTDMKGLVNLLDGRDAGYGAEFNALLPTPPQSSSKWLHPINLQRSHNGVELKVRAGGRYIHSDDPRVTVHQLSLRLLKNKDKNKRVVQDDIFFQTYRDLIKVYFALDWGDICITSIPSRPGHEDRFKLIVRRLSDHYGIDDLSGNLICVKDYPAQKFLNVLQRFENVKGCFQYEGRLDSKHVILLDDILTTGATALECARVMYDKGAARVTLVVLAVNQKPNEWRKKNVKLLTCPRCGQKMLQRINSRTNEAFYGCADYEHCRGNLTYADGRLRFLAQNDLLTTDVETEELL